MDYSKVIEYDSITLYDCISMFETNGIISVLEDGRITNLTKGEQ